MAINFPIPTQVGEVFTDPSSGNTYTCSSLGPPAEWTSTTNNADLNQTYLRLDASNGPVDGNLGIGGTFASPNIALNADGTATYVGAITAPNVAVAWSNFNGFLAASGYQGRNSLNIGQITKLGTGSYAVTFATARDDFDYAVIVTASGQNASQISNEPAIAMVRNKTTTGFEIVTYDLSNASAKPQQGVRECNVDFAVYDQ